MSLLLTSGFEKKNKNKVLMNFNLLIRVKKKTPKSVNTPRIVNSSVSLLKSKPVQGEIPTSNSKHYVIKVIM